MSNSHMAERFAAKMPPRPSCAHDYQPSFEYLLENACQYASMSDGFPSHDATSLGQQLEFLSNDTFMSQAAEQYCESRTEDAEQAWPHNFLGTSAEYEMSWGVPLSVENPMAAHNKLVREHARQACLEMERVRKEEWAQDSVRRDAVLQAKVQELKAYREKYLREKAAREKLPNGQNQHLGSRPLPNMVKSISSDTEMQSGNLSLSNSSVKEFDSTKTLAFEFSKTQNPGQAMPDQTLLRVDFTAKHSESLRAGPSVENDSGAAISVTFEDANLSSEIEAEDNSWELVSADDSDDGFVIVDSNALPKD